MGGGGGHVGRGPCRGGPRVLHVLGLVEDHAVPGLGGEEGGVAPQQAVRRDAHRGAVEHPAEVVDRLRAVGAVLVERAQSRGEAAHLPFPRAQHREWADDECGPRIGEEEGDRLHRLAQAHVVGEAASETLRVQAAQPGQADGLVATELAVEPGGRRGRRGGGLLQRPGEAGDLAARDDTDLVEMDVGEVRVGEGAGEGGGDDLGGSQDRRSSGEDTARLRERRRVDHEPLPLAAHQRVAVAFELGELRIGEDVSAQGRLPGRVAVAEEELQPEPAGTAGVEAGGHGHVEAVGRQSGRCRCEEGGGVGDVEPDVPAGVR